MSKPTTDDERRMIIWSTNAWVGANEDLSDAARAEIFRIAVFDRLPDVTPAEVGYALGLVIR